MRAKNFKSLTLLALASLLVIPLAACKKKSRAGNRTVKATISTFDPNADYSLEFSDDDGGEGSERPDDWKVHEAFNQSFGGMDGCVQSTKERKGMKPTSQLQGGMKIAVKLVGKKRPGGVNAKLTSRKWNGDKALKDCIREAVAAVPYPEYNGPPIVAEFDVDELDAGAEVEECDDFWGDC